MKNDKLTEIGVLIVYAADVLDGLKVRDTRQQKLLDKTFAHLDRAAGSLAELLHIQARPRHLRRMPRGTVETSGRNLRSKPPVETSAAIVPEAAPETVSEVPVKKKRGRKPNPICPHCKARPKVAGGAYCAECRRELQREYQRRRTQRARERRETPEPPPADPAEPSAPSSETEDAKTLYDRMIAECKKRGYDPDLMLGLAQALPKVEFRKSGGYLVPVWHGKISGRSHSYHPDEEEK